MHEGRIRLTLLASGLRWRAWTTVAMLFVAVVGVGIGAFGPLYLHGADQSILNATLDGAPPGVLGLTMQPVHAPGSTAQLSAAYAQVPQPGASSHWFGAPIVTDEAGIDVASKDEDYAAGLIARTDVCRHLVMVAGVCTGANGAAVMSTRSAALLGVKTGQTLHLAFSRSGRTAALRLSGLYRATAPTDPYWWGVNYFAFGTTAGPRRTALDALFTSATTLQRVAPPLLVSHLYEVSFKPGSLSIDQVPAFQQMVTAYEKSVHARNGVVVTTALPAYLARAGTTQHTSTLIIAVIDVELVLLVACVLYFVAFRTAAERAPDVRLAVLRGYPPRSTWAVAMAEPIAVVVVAVPIGLLLAWAVFIASSRALFGAAVGSMTLLAAGAAVASGVAAAGAVMVGNRRAMTTGDLDPAEQPSRRSGILQIVLGTAAVALAIAAFVELTLRGVSNGSGGSTSDPLSALAPALLALALGLLGTQLLPAALRTRHRSGAPSAGVPWTLASRRVARRAEFGPQIVILSLAAGLAVFAVSGWVISARNRTVQDEFSVGASRVLTVSVRPGVNFLAAVRAAAAPGSAMAVVVENATDGTTLAVDASRMAGVMSWPAGLGADGAQVVARRLVPRGLPPAVFLSGDTVRLTVDTTASIQPVPQLALDLFDTSYQTPQRVELGDLVPGRSTYQASIAGLCVSTCRLVDVDVTWSPPATVTASPPIHLQISSLSDHVDGRWVPVDAGLDTAARWSSPSGAARLTSSSSGLGAVAALSPYGTPMELAPSDTPVKLPAVVTPTVVEFDSGIGLSLSIVGLDGGTVSAQSVGLVPALPRVGSAALVDLGTAERLLDGPFADATTEVWLSKNAPAGIEANLERQGVTTLSTDSVGARQSATVHGGVELAYSLFLMAAIAAGALALGSTAFAIVVSARMREPEFAAMRSVGISKRSLRRSVQAEQALATGSGLLLGVGAGIVSALVALKSIPEFVALGPGPPLQLSLPLPDLLVTVGTLVAALGLTVLLSSAVVGSRPPVDRLGDGR